MRKTNWSLVLLVLVTMAAGAVVGSALRGGMAGSFPVQAGEPYWLASSTGR